jgi:hypothetical protein
MKVKGWIWAGLLLGISTSGEPCDRFCCISPGEVVHNADAIVRAVVLGYALEAPTWTNGEPDSRVRFKTIEVVKGSDVPQTIDLSGELTDQDDFNDDKVPYTFVRPDGRHGNCFATSYRVGAEFLLMLKRRPDGAYTVNWYSLGPVNEQLRSADDPWLVWVREQTRRIRLDVAFSRTYSARRIAFATRRRESDPVW